MSVANPKPAPQSSELSGLIVQKFAYTEVKPGLFTAEINAPTPEGEYEINTIVAYKDQSVIPTETRLTALVDPEGYVYQKISGLQARIANTTVSLYWLNPNTNKYEIWQAGKFMQKNPVITDTTGNYSFLVPSGTYYLTAKAPNYYDYKSESFVIKENNSVAMDIELKAKKVGWFNWVEVIAISLLVIIVLFCILIMVHIKGRNNSF